MLHDRVLSMPFPDVPDQTPVDPLDPRRLPSPHDHAYVSPRIDARVEPTDPGRVPVLPQLGEALLDLLLQGVERDVELALRQGQRVVDVVAGPGTW